MVQRAAAVSFTQPCNAADLFDICRWAGLDRTRGLRLLGIPRAVFDRLVRQAAQHNVGNHYHHAGHFAHVIIAAGILSSLAGLGRRDRALLVLAALTHDLGHLGQRASQTIFQQETASATRVRQILLGGGVDVRLTNRLFFLLRATALTDHPDRLTILASDPLARLLADADVFASLYYRHAAALQMTRALKHEQRLEGDAEAILENFRSRMQTTPAWSEALQELLTPDEGR